jgi:C-type mannose receptor
VGTGGSSTGGSGTGGSNTGGSSTGGSGTGGSNTGGTGGSTGSCFGQDEIEGIGTCYLRIKSPTASWENARQACIAWGGDLISIDSEEEQTFIGANLMDANDAWIGLNELAAAGTWVWSNGSTADYRNWDAGEPNSTSENCAAIYARWAKPGTKVGFWFDGTCSNTKPYICER